MPVAPRRLPVIVMLGVAACAVALAAASATAHAATPSMKITGKLRGATGMTLLALSPSGTAVQQKLGACFVAAGVAIGCVETAENAAVATFAPADVRGSAFGLLAALQSAGNLAASGFAGLLWTAVSPRAAFIYAATCMVLALAGLAVARRHT